MFAMFTLFRVFFLLRIYFNKFSLYFFILFFFSPFDVKNPYLAEVSVNRELHKSGDRSCMHIELNIEGSKLRYDTGDHVAVYPKNSSEDVEKIGKLLNANLDTVFSLLNTDGMIISDYYYFFFYVLYKFINFVIYAFYRRVQ